MANIIKCGTINMLDASNGFWQGTVFQTTPTSISISNGSKTGIYWGDFTNGLNGNITGYTEINKGYSSEIYAANIEITNISVNSSTLLKYQANNDYIGFEKFILNGSDTVNFPGEKSVISTFGGDDLINALYWDTYIDGGTGYDTVWVSKYAMHSHLDVYQNCIKYGTVYNTAPDYFVNIEKINFNYQSPVSNSIDQQHSLSIETRWLTDTLNASSSTIDKITDIYIAYYNRCPDVLGLCYWVSRYTSGMDLESIAKSFFVQPETTLNYSSVANTNDFVTKVYNNVLNRTPDQAGLNYWVNQLNNGSVSKDSFFLAVINGAYAPTGSINDKNYLVGKHNVGEHYSISDGLTDLAHATNVMNTFDATYKSSGLNTAINTANNLSDGYLTNVKAFGEKYAEFTINLVGGNFDISNPASLV